MPYKKKEDRNARNRWRYANDPEFRETCLRYARGAYVKSERGPSGAPADWEYRRILKRRGLIEDQMARCWGQIEPCRACGTTESLTKNGFCIDHDHETGRVRDVTCDRCNRTAGHSGDNPVLLRQVADYLEAA